MNKLEILKKEVERLQELIPMMQSIQGEIGYADVKECADTGLVLKQLTEAIHTVKRIVEQTGELAQTWAVLGLVHKNESMLRTDEYTASVRNRVWYRLPSSRNSNPEWFDTVLTGIGVPREVAEKELVRIHHPAFAEYCATIDPLPPGVNKKDLSDVNLRLTYRLKGGKSDAGGDADTGE